MTDEYKIPMMWVIAHVLLAFLAVFVSGFAKIWSIAALVIGFIYTAKNRNRNNEAAIAAAYFSGIEIILRMQNAMIGYEMAKYAVIGYLLFGMMFENNKSVRNPIWIIAFFLLIPSMFIAESFEGIRFSVSGIIALLISAYYFQGRFDNKYNHTKLLSFIILPIISAAIVITLKTPDYSTVAFTADSNALMSGGYGPIHVSTVLSIGLIVLIMFMMLHKNIFRYYWLNYVIIFFIAFRLLFTFARSGLFSLILSLVFSFFFYLKDKSFKKSKSFISIIVVGLIFLVAWSQIDHITGGMSVNRYMGKNSFGEQKEDITTGRSELNHEDMEIFLSHPILGVGAGNVDEYRLAHYGFAATSHMEYTRLLAEHGLFGLFVILILFIETFIYLRTTKGNTRLFFVAFTVFTLSNIIPAATRTALPMLLYGLAFMKIKEDYNLE